MSPAVTSKTISASQTPPRAKLRFAKLRKTKNAKTSIIAGAIKNNQIIVTMLDLGNVDW